MAVLELFLILSKKLSGLDGGGGVGLADGVALFEDSANTCGGSIA